jgi:hypothetical protein
MRTIKEFFKQTLPSPIWSGLVAANRVGIQAQHAAELHFNRKHWQSTYRLRAFKDKHRGERCFIIGNGPSLNRMDLSPLRNEFTFGMNRIYLLFPKLGFHTTYFVSVNKLVIEQSAHEIASLPMPKFLSWQSRTHIPFTKGVTFLKTVGGKPQFAFDLSKTVWESGTVTYVALQLAYYMGFQKVILIGVDHNFVTKGPANTTVVSEGNDPNHFAPNYFGKDFRWQLPDLYHSELGYQLAHNIYVANGREIVNATVDGRLEIFPKVDYDDLF